MEYSTFVRLPFEDELASLEDVYGSALRLDVSGLADWLGQRPSRPLLVLASGGSTTAAAVAVDLHQRATGQLSKTGGPTEIWTYGTSLPGSMGLVLSAGGQNSDSLAMARSLRRSTGNWGVLVGALGTPMVNQLDGSQVACFSYDLMPKLHGWVPVGATLGQVVVLARAYATAFPSLGSVPEPIASLLPLGSGNISEALDKLEAALSPVLAREHLLCLFTPATASFAADLEAKFAEGALGFIQLSDIRNFTHGRYQSLLANSEACGILIVHSDEEEDYARRYASLIPSEVPLRRLGLPSPNAVHTQLASVVAALGVVGALGRIRGLEPGWGSVCTWGDAIYDLSLPETYHRSLEEE